ncbi:MAG: hypothetical protein M1813_000680 [Trichoglossum hirsutum]|nr:MAG: hypothetical protein M1813_000680 [Trichoglossum hirsutum]
MDGPPPPPPPHGASPKSSGLPPGNYDIFIIPPHSSGSGFLYLPSLQPQRNSFLAGVGCTLGAVLVLQIVTPVLREWLATILATGGSGVAMLVLAVGIAGWAWGRTQFEPPAPDPGGRGFGGGNASGGPEQTNRNPPSGNPGEQSRDNPGDATGTAPGGASGGPPGGAGARPKPTWQQRRNSGSEGSGAGGGGTTRGGWSGTGRTGETSGGPAGSGAGTGRGGWEKAREETRRKEEERKRREDEKKRQEEERKRRDEEDRRAKEAAERERWERARTREREAREREAREKEAREREAREREAREKEAREREAKEREAREREARERREKEEKERQDRERQEREREKERQEKQKQEKEKRDREKQERERREREQQEKAKQEKESEDKARKGKIATTYAVTVGERTNPYIRTPTMPGPSAFKAPDTPPPSTNTRKANGPTVSSPTKPPSSPTKRNQASAKSYLGPDDDAYSFRPYDRPKQHLRKESSHSSVYSESSYAPSQSTSRTSPPPSQRGTYSTKDPDKIVIRAVYSFNNAFIKLPTAQLVSGVGSVTDGLILKITTEGLFIDDDVRGVPQREWDIKAWTMKTVEVWCPHFWASGASSGSSAPATGSTGHHRNPVRRLFSDGKDAPTSEETDLLLETLLRLCKSNCSMTGPRGMRGRDPNGTSQNGDCNGLHVLRASIKDQEGKKYVFVLEEEEGWKVAVGLQQLRRGTQVRAMGVGRIGKEEARAILENLGWD